MPVYGWLALYCVAVLIMSLAGGSLPFLGRVTHDRLQFYLSASAGVMLGAAFFHVMPDAMERSKENFGWWMSLGVIGLFCIERFIAPHSHELDGGGHHHHHHHDHAHYHAHAEKPAEQATTASNHPDRRAAAPAVAGWMAVVGLTIHTFMNGVGLAAAVQTDAANQTAASHNPSALMLPGFALFLAIVLHKPADALAISTVLSRKQVSKSVLGLVQFGFAITVALGALAYCATSGAIEAGLRNELAGAALAFSAGTFLFIALSDLLPEVQFHRHDRVPLFLTLFAGIVLMGGISYLEDHDHEHEHGAPAVEQHEHHSAGESHPDHADEHKK
jgi:zinc and cadmium transporter